MIYTDVEHSCDVVGGFGFGFCVIFFLSKHRSPLNTCSCWRWRWTYVCRRRWMRFHKWELHWMLIKCKTKRIQQGLNAKMQKLSSENQKRISSSAWDKNQGWRWGRRGERAPGGCSGVDDVAVLFTLFSVKIGIEKRRETDVLVVAALPDVAMFYSSRCVAPCWKQISIHWM